MNTEIICILDKSGSMAPLRHDVLGGFNSFLAEQKALPGEARITLVLFNGDTTDVFEAKRLADAADLTLAQYAPVGSTALLDAIGATLERHAKRIASENWAQQVIVNIITDGEENCSTVYKLDQVKTMITHAQDKAGWVFLFQAANQDAFLAGGQYGISGATTMNFVASGAGMRSAYGATSASVTSLRALATGLDDGVPLPNAVATTPVPQPQPSGVLPDAVADHLAP